MRKISLMCFMLFSLLFVKAQQWCTPGSIWYHETSNPLWNTQYTKQSYLYDTVVGADSFNKIKLETHGENISGGYQNFGYMFTCLKNNVVFFDGNNSSNLQAIDTLIYFGPVGSKWRVRPREGSTDCSNSTVEIIGVGTESIQGQNVNWYKINYTYSQSYGGGSPQISSGTDTIFERIGYKKYGFHFYFCGNFIEAPPAAKFRCFQDNQISVKSFSLACDYTTEIKENNELSPSFLVYPNPANNVLTIKSNKQNTNYVTKLYNTLGVEVLSATSREQSFIINTSGLINSIYFLKVFDGNKLLNVEKIVVQH